MALRLTSTNLHPGASASPFGGSAPSADALAMRARSLLTAGDVAGYTALFGEADTHEEPQRRYQAQVALLEQGIIGTGPATQAVATRIFAAVADAALGLLEKEPSEPVLLNYAGVACYELWSLEAAQALFKAARRLDPALPNVDRNLEELARRKRVAGRPTRPLHASVPGLARRARSVAGRARPAAGLTISLCMIVRDEEQMLPRCLEAVAPAVDEMVIVDTGSKDRTIEIARSFGARVIEQPWTGSFSEPRNISFDAATGDWLFYLDADEVLVADDVSRLRALSGHTWREAFYLVETSYLGELGEGYAVNNSALRIFRNRPGYRFTGRLHEQILETLPTWAAGRFEPTAVRIEHYGYLGSVREAKEKSRRNIELLRKQADESPSNPFFHFNLGSEYGAVGDFSLAVSEHERSRKMLLEQGIMLPSVEFAPLLMVRLAHGLNKCGRTSDARETATEGLEQFPDLTDLVFAQAEAAKAVGDDAEMVTLYERCIELGDAPAKYGGAVGCGTFMPRIALADHHWGRGETRAARELLEWCVDHHPEFVPVAGPYATVLLADGVPPSEIIAELDRLETVTPRVGFLVASALAKAGAVSEAEGQYRKVIDAAPTNARAHVALAESLLGHGSWAEAAHHAALVPDDDPYAALACRIELCATIGRGGREPTDVALRRAYRAGVPTAERRVFEAWAAVADGSPPPEGLSVGSVPMLGVALQTLLRAGDMERFAALVPVLRRSRLPVREQRHLLADMFLAGGITKLAAQEWMAICSDGPDSRALLGLARVAAAHGMEEDAATFAKGTLELDPECAPARELLSLIPAATITGDP
jgi:tetratricopeptide (TPR) repeat protein